MATLRIALFVLTLALSGCDDSYDPNIPDDMRGGPYYIHIEDLHHRPVVGAKILVESSWSSTNITGGWGGKDGKPAQTKISDKNGNAHFLYIGLEPLMTITKEGHRELKLGLKPLDPKYPSPDAPRIIIFGRLDELRQ